MNITEAPIVFPSLCMNSPVFQKKRDSRIRCLSTKLVGLALDDGSRGADIGTGAAIDACISVDYIDIAFRDSTGRAFGLAGSASHASISDFVSHDIDSLLRFRCF
jgi:hypothetical protein